MVSDMDNQDERLGIAESLAIAFGEPEPRTPSVIALDRGSENNSVKSDRMLDLLTFKLAEVVRLMGSEVEDISLHLSETREGRELHFRAYRRRTLPTA